MDLTPYVDKLRRELAVAAAAGGEDARALADRLTAPLDSAVRIALLEALSDAAEEITLELAPGSVDVRLRGREPDFVVTPPPADDLPYGAASDGFEGLPAGVGAFPAAERPAPVPTPAAAPAAPPEADEGATARITLRLPESLKPRIDEAAGRDGLSVNAWLVRTVTAALDPDHPARDSARRTEQRIGQHFTGWVR